MYSLHITKKSYWADPIGNKITSQEWEKLSSSLPEYYSYDGENIRVTNPDQKTIEEMKTIAEALSAKVQGDDGEEY